jgi:hypothetical protein
MILCSRTFVLFTLRTLVKAIICCQVKTKVDLVELKDLDYPQKFLLRVVATK